MTHWIAACGVDDIDDEDLIRFDHGGKTFAIYKSPEGTFYATDGQCTHEQAHLSGGLVMGDKVECPKHNGQFNYKTGAAVRLPCVMNIKTHPVRVTGGTVEIGLE